jgi:hypothetical protein
LTSRSDEVTMGRRHGSPQTTPHAPISRPSVGDRVPQARFAGRQQQRSTCARRRSAAVEFRRPWRRGVEVQRSTEGMVVGDIRRRPLEIPGRESRRATRGSRAGAGGALADSARPATHGSHGLHGCAPVSPHERRLGLSRDPRSAACRRCRARVLDGSGGPNSPTHQRRRLLITRRRPPCWKGCCGCTDRRTCQATRRSCVERIPRKTSTSPGSNCEPAPSSSS